MRTSGIALLTIRVFQVFRLQAGQDVQRQHPHRVGQPQAALLHRPRRPDVQIRPQLPPQPEAYRSREVRRV